MRHLIELVDVMRGLEYTSPQIAKAIEVCTALSTQGIYIKSESEYVIGRLKDMFKVNISSIDLFLFTSFQIDQIRMHSPNNGYYSNLGFGYRNSKDIKISYSDRTTPLIGFAE